MGQAPAHVKLYQKTLASLASLVDTHGRYLAKHIHELSVVYTPSDSMQCIHMKSINRYFTHFYDPSPASPLHSSVGPILSVFFLLKSICKCNTQPHWP